MSRIASVDVVPLAFADPPLLNSWGVHEPLALRSLVRLRLTDGTLGYGEASGDITVLGRLRDAARALEGLRVDDAAALAAAVAAAVDPSLPEVARQVVHSPFAVAALDALGRLEGVPVVDLLGGAVRDRVEFCGYLFYKWARHPGSPDDGWGAALDTEGIVAQAELMTRQYGFRSLKLKGGVLPPDAEIEAMRAIATAFPEALLRIDPNGAWRESTALELMAALPARTDYVEDPVLGIDGLAAVRASGNLPIASNMTINTSTDLARAVEAGALDIVLADLHYWGGPVATLALARECADAGLTLSMHSNSHLGVTLAAMTHVAAAMPELASASDTHYPWNRDDDIVAPGTFEFEDGFLAVPDGPGLGVEVDESVVARLHEQYVRSGRTVRDDTAYARSIDPAYDPTLPRF
jgi:glucarate dehydratase